MKNNSLLFHTFPHLDLHGEKPELIEYIVNDFLNDQIKLGKDEAIIIHGIGKYVIKNKLYEILKDNKSVVDYHLTFNNIGETYVKLLLTK